MAETVLFHPQNVQPNRFTLDDLGWLAWLEPLSEADLTERHREALMEPARIKSPYFMLLARDPDILEARTKTDKDIFYNPHGGLPRAERELAATATSRFNGCIFCASVHARFASTYSKRRDEIQHFLDIGTNAEFDDRWDAIVSAAIAIAATPIEFDKSHIKRLRAAGLDDAAIADLIHSAAFFNWANRLMLSLGEPSLENPS